MSVPLNEFKTTTKPIPTQQESIPISGLSYHQEVIAEDFENELVKWIEEKGQWNRSLPRLTQHYGLKEYSYNKSVKQTKDLKDAAPIPEIFLKLIEELRGKKVLEEKEEVDQCIVNRYVLGEGISPHTDHQTFFAEPILSVSLNSSCVMEFDLSAHNNIIKDVRNVMIPVLLEQRSVVVLRGEARLNWRHAIKPKKIDHYPSLKYHKARALRYSITFRKLRL
jgi:alkylated DNA repair dioxygenase AlkB